MALTSFATPSAAHTPSKAKLITLDLVIAAFQFVVVVLSCGAAHAEGHSASTAPDGPSALLGDDIDEWSDDEDAPSFESDARALSSASVHCPLADVAP